MRPLFPPPPCGNTHDSCATLSRPAPIFVNLTVLALGRASTPQLSMTKQSSSGEGPDTSRDIHLPPAGRYQRPLWHGPGVSFYAGNHPADEWELHEHRQVQAILVLSPVRHGLITGEPGREKQTDYHGPGVIVLPAGIRHALVWPEAGLLVKMYFTVAFMKEVLQSPPSEMIRIDLVGLVVRDRAIMHLAESFVPLCQGQPPPNSQYPGSLANVFGTHLLWALFGGESNPGRSGGLRLEARRRFEAHLQAHLGQGYRPAAFARAAGISLNHFHVLFRLTYGQKLRSFFRERQVLAAQALLLTSDEKILEIALRVGFGSSGAMVVWFREILGCTPSDVRRSRRRP